MFKITYPNNLELMGTLNVLKKNYRISNNAIAKAAGVSPTTVSKWLNYKTTGCRKEHHEKLEDFIARTWQPALICVTKFGHYPHNFFFNVGDVHDPFYTWIHYYVTPEQDKEDIKFVEECEQALANKEAKLYVVKLYKDMDEANTLGREEERLYNIGAMTNSDDINVTFFGKGEPVVKKSLIFVPPDENA